MKADPDSLPLYEILGMTPDELENMSRDFVSMFETEGDLFNLCRLLVDKYGLEAVFMSISWFRVLKVVRSNKSRSTVKPPDKEVIDAWISKLQATMSDN